MPDAPRRAPLIWSLSRPILTLSPHKSSIPAGCDLSQGCCILRGRNRWASLVQLGVDDAPIEVRSEDEQGEVLPPVE